MRSTKIGAVALAGMLSLTLAACGDDEESTDAGGGGGATEPVVLAGPIMLNDGVTTSVKLDPAFLQGLTALGVTPGVVGPTELNGDTLVFTITGGQVTLYEKGTKDPFITGLIEHDNNGITLTAGGTTVKLENFDIDPGASILKTDVAVNDKVVAEDVPTFFLDGSTLNYPPTDVNGPGTATLKGTTVKLTAEAVGLLNDTFKLTGTDKALPEFFPVGVATIVVGTQGN